MFDWKSSFSIFCLSKNTSGLITFNQSHTDSCRTYISIDESTVFLKKIQVASSSHVECEHTMQLYFRRSPEWSFGRKRCRAYRKRSLQWRFHLVADFNRWQISYPRATAVKFSRDLSYSPQFVPDHRPSPATPPIFPAQRFRYAKPLHPRGTGAIKFSRPLNKTHALRRRRRPRDRRFAAKRHAKPR